MDSDWQITSVNWAPQRGDATTPGYDDFGNRLSQAKVPGSPGTPPEVTLSYGEATNRITTGGYTYDLNGNITAMPGITGIGWDVFDRMSGTSVPGTTRTFKYDAFGRRMDSGTYPYGHHIYFYDMGGRLLAEYGNVYSGATPTKKYEYFAGQQLGQYKDRVGSVRNTNGGIGSHYYPFGEEITSTANDRYKFAETFRDADSGLDYALNRYYAASIGRFLSVDAAQADPVRPQSFNRYAYAENDPANFNDPTGTYIKAPNGCFYFAGSLVCAFQPVYSRPRGGYGPGPPDDAIDLGERRWQDAPILQLATKAQQPRFGIAWADAGNRLTGSCAALFGDGAGNTLDSATYDMGAAFKPGTADLDPRPYATTNPDTQTVTINLVGFFFNLSNVVDKNGNPVDMKMGTGLSDTDFRAFVLLHELAHLTKKLGDDVSTPENVKAGDDFNKSIMGECFGKKNWERPKQ